MYHLPATILVVDDNHENLRLLARILKGQDYDVRLAPDGKLGLMSAYTDPPDLILLDIDMPGMDGYEVCRKVKKNPLTKHIPVIFVSALDETVNVVDAFQSGGVDYIIRPFQIDDVLIRVQNQLNIQQTQQALRQRIAFEELVTTFSTRFISVAIDQVDDEICQALEAIGTFAEVDHGYITLFDDTITVMGHGYEWSVLHGARYMQEQKGMSLALFSWSMNKLKQGDVINVSSMDDLPPEAQAEKEHWMEMGNKSLFAIPLIQSHTLIGFFGFSCRVSERRWAEEDIQMLRVMGDMFVGVLARKQAEQTLCEERDKSQTYLDLAGVMFVALDSKGNVSLINRKGCELLGYTQEEIVGKNWFMMCIPERERHNVAHIFYSLMKGDIEIVEYFENPVVVRNGEERMVAWHNTCLWNEHGTIVGILGSGEDITERKQAETLQTTQLQVTRILTEAETMDDAIPRLLQALCEGLDWQIGEMWRVDTKRNVLHCTHVWHEPSFVLSDFVLFTPLHTFAWGVGLPGLVWQQGKPDWMADIARNPAFVRSTLAADAGLQASFAFPIGGKHECEGVMCFLSRSIRPFGSALADMMADVGQQIHHFFQRKHVEEDLALERASLAQQVDEKTVDLKMVNTELARAVKARDEFLAMMSHELRTPLHAILTLSESLMEEVYGPLVQQQHKALSSIEESGRHLLELINDILDIARIEAGKVDLRVEPVQIDHVCQASLKLVREAIKKKHLTYDYRIDEHVSAMMVDERRLKQILVNLLSNAIKFTPEGGRVALDVIGDVEEEVVHFVVCDTGIGISEEDVGRLFKPFVQLDSSLSRQYQGTGLGLVMVSRLVALHSGSVSLESNLGKGSKFTVSLPWYEKQVEPVYGEQVIVKGLKERIDEQAMAAAESHHTSVLVVDDNQPNLVSVVDYLQMCGYHVFVAHDGLDAIEQAMAQRPSIILMDIQMPVMDGLDAIRRLRLIDECATIPIIALTSLALPGDREICLQAGASDYVTKPVSLQKLVQLIEKHTES